MLLDIHGQGLNPDVIDRCTANAQTVSHLMSASGRDAIDGPEGLMGQIATAGIAVVPANDQKQEQVEPRMNGGWTIRAYGSEGVEAFDAIQLEFGRRFRTGDCVQAAQILADANYKFAVRYVKGTS